MTRDPRERQRIQTIGTVQLCSPRHGSWAEARGLLTAVLDQLEEDGHPRAKLRAALMSLAQQGWPKKKQGLRVERSGR
jgi:hypothetical protein